MAPGARALERTVDGQLHNRARSTLACLAETESRAIIVPGHTLRTFPTRKAPAQGTHETMYTYLRRGRVTEKRRIRSEPEDSACSSHSFTETSNAVGGGTQLAQMGLFGAEVVCGWPSEGQGTRDHVAVVE
jgi:hypothetical protein